MAFVTPAAHSASNGSFGDNAVDVVVVDIAVAALMDLARDCNDNVGGRFIIGAGDVLLTTCPNHWSALGSGVTVSIGTVLGEDDNEVETAATPNGELLLMGVVVNGDIVAIGVTTTVDDGGGLVVEEEARRGDI